MKLLLQVFGLALVASALTAGSFPLAPPDVAPMPRAAARGPGADRSPVEVAPPPRLAVDYRVSRAGTARTAVEPYGGLESEWNGVVWKVSLDVDGDPGREVLSFNWSLRYDGPRQPLIILPPSLSATRSVKDTTSAVVYAFPKGREDGRVVRISTPDPHGDWLTWPPADCYLTVRKGRTARGVVPLPVAVVRAKLRNWYPKEFAGAEPPDLYVELYHEPASRGDQHRLDAWTGWLHSDTIKVPPLKGW